MTPPGLVRCKPKRCRRARSAELEHEFNLLPKRITETEGESSRFSFPLAGLDTTGRRHLKRRASPPAGNLLIPIGAAGQRFFSHQFLSVCVRAGWAFRNNLISLMNQAHTSTAGMREEIEPRDTPTWAGQCKHANQRTILELTKAAAPRPLQPAGHFECHSKLREKPIKRRQRLAQLGVIW